MVVARIGDHPPFEAIDFEFFTALAAQAVIAMENARLYDVERQRAVELSQALAQQQELDQLKNTFIQNVSHELRTPLAIIRGYAELLLAGDLGTLSEQQFESVEVMARRARMLGKMLDDLLAILAVETHKFEKEPVDLAQPDAGGHHRFSSVRQTGGPLVGGDDCAGCSQGLRRCRPSAARPG